MLLMALGFIGCMSAAAQADAVHSSQDIVDTATWKSAKPGSLNESPFYGTRLAGNATALSVARAFIV